MHIQELMWKIVELIRFLQDGVKRGAHVNAKGEGSTSVFPFMYCSATWWWP
jgi:hypothetical protein